MERDVASYSFISWLDPYIHRRQAKHKLVNDDAFDASMVNREGSIENSTQDDMQALCFNSTAADDVNNEDSVLSESDLDEEEGGEDDEHNGEEHEHENDDDKKEILAPTMISITSSTSGSMADVLKSNIVQVLPNNTLNFSPTPTTSAMMNPINKVSTNVPNDFAAGPSSFVNIVTPNIVKNKSGEIAFVPQVSQQSRKTISMQPRPTQYLPKVSSYMSIKPYPYAHNYNRSSKYSRLMEKYSATTTSPKRFAVADSTKSNAKVMNMNHCNHASRLRHLVTNAVPQSSSEDLNSTDADEGSLLVRLIKTKMDKLPERLKLSCQNELLQTVLKYELMAVDEKSKAREKAATKAPENRDKKRDTVMEDPDEEAAGSVVAANDV